MELNQSQINFLRWIRDNDHNVSRWLNEDGKSPNRKKPNFSIMEITGPMGSVRISSEDEQHILHMFEADDIKRTRRIFKLSSAGEAALAQSALHDRQDDAGGGEA
jgi:hypothetical protein